METPKAEKQEQTEIENGGLEVMQVILHKQSVIMEKLNTYIASVERRVDVLEQQRDETETQGKVQSRMVMQRCSQQVQRKPEARKKK